jgi:hypothetical protein
MCAQRAAPSVSLQALDIEASAVKSAADAPSAPTRESATSRHNAEGRRATTERLGALRRTCMQVPRDVQRLLQRFPRPAQSVAAPASARTLVGCVLFVCLFVCLFVSLFAAARLYTLNPKP